MPVPIASGAPTLCIRRDAYERAGVIRAQLDTRLGLTDNEFRVEGSVVIVGPIYGAALDDLFAELDEAGLQYFEDYFELSGNWPDWLQLHASAR